MNMLKRNACIVTDDINMEHLYTFKKFPIHMGVTDKPESDDINADMIFTINHNSGMIQLKELVPMDELYIDEHYNSIGTGWDKHHKAFAVFIKKFCPKSVFEIGGARGILEKCYSEIDKIIPWTILEPTPNPIEGCHADYILGFFDDNFQIPKGFNAIVHSHTFEHIYEPNKFIRHIAESIENDDYMFFSIPNLKRMLEKRFTNVLNFEHTYFCAEPYVDYFLTENGFQILSKEYFGDDHSIFYAAKKMNGVKKADLDADLYLYNKQLYLNYINEHEILVKNINMRMINETRPIYLFGAHVYAQYLIGFGLDLNKIICILDNDPIKQGKRLNGSNLMVHSPAILKNEINPIIILRAGTHCAEIKADILNNINENAEFIE